MDSRAAYLQLPSFSFGGKLSSATPISLTTLLDASFSFAGISYAVPRISMSTPFSSLSDIPPDIVRQIENDGAAIFAGLIATAAAYLDVVYRGLVTVGDEIGSVLKTGYGLTADQAAADMKAAGFAVTDIGNALINGWSATAADVASTLSSAGYSVSEAGTFIKNAFNLGPDALHSALQAAGYATDQIGNFFNDLGGDFSSWASDNLDPTKW